MDGRFEPLPAAAAASPVASDDDDDDDEAVVSGAGLAPEAGVRPPPPAMGRSATIVVLLAGTVAAPLELVVHCSALRASLDGAAASGVVVVVVPDLSRAIRRMSVPRRMGNVPERCPAPYIWTATGARYYTIMTPPEGTPDGSFAPVVYLCVVRQHGR